MGLHETAEELVTELRRENRKIALAESCTGGLAAKALTDIPGASEVFECGVVSYSSRIKEKVLGVDPQTIRKYSVVSRLVAEQMAEGVRVLGDADLGVGITGVAGPGPDGEHPEGEIHIAVSDGTHMEYALLQTGTHGERAYNRTTAAERALRLAAELLKRGTSHVR